MTTASSTQRPLTQLTREIEQLEAEAKRLETERAAIARDVRNASRRIRYLRLAQSIRRPAAQFNQWPLAVMFIGPVIVGFLVLVFVNLLTNSYPAAFFGFLVGIVAGVGLFASLIYHPADTLLPTAAHEAESSLRLANARLQEKMERISETKTQLKKFLDERRDQIASGKLQKAALLQRNWKQMGDAEWEDFIVEVCRTLGAKVERTRRTDDANLVVEFDSHRVAILTQGENHVVSSDTVRQALAAQERHHCDGCAVIINRRFTGAAQDFARHNGCTAIGAAEFPDFVLGKIEI